MIVLAAMAALLAFAERAESTPKTGTKLNLRLTYDEQIVKAEETHTEIVLTVPKYDESKINKIVKAQSIIESGECKHIPAPHNCWGRKAVGGGYLAFKNYDEALADQKSYTQRLLKRCDGNLACYSQRYAEAPDYHKRLIKIMEGL